MRCGWEVATDPSETRPTTAEWASSAARWWWWWLAAPPRVAAGRILLGVAAPPPAIEETAAVEPPIFDLEILLRYLIRCRLACHFHGQPRHCCLQTPALRLRSLPIRNTTSSARPLGGGCPFECRSPHWPCLTQAPLVAAAS